MLDNAEFAAIVRIPTESVANITPEVEPFTLFSLECKGLNPNGKTVKFNLWNVQKTSTASIKALIKADREREQAENLARYIEQGWAFENPNNMDVDDDDDELEM